MTRGLFRNWQTFALIHLLSISSSICDARLLSAYEQAYGPWSIKLNKNIFGKRIWHLQTVDYANAPNGIRRKRGRRKKQDGDLQLLFPEVVRMPNDDDILNNGNDTTSNENDGENETQIQSRSEQARYTTKSVRSVSCILNLEKNGKFMMSLVEDEKYNKKNALGEGYQHDPSNTLSSTQNHQASNSIQHQPLQGEWFLTPNPYCITDRHFDTLLLVSEPRMRRRQGSVIIEKATVELRCKIWGRYGVGAVREKIGLKHGRVRGRMTHGTVVIVKEEVIMGGDERIRRKLPKREVVGTFRGKTIVDPDSVGRNDSLNNADELLDDDGDDDDLDFGDNFDQFGVLRPITADE